MNNTATPDYSLFDRAEIVSVLFHPRKESESVAWPDNVQHLLIPVASEVTLGAAFHHADKKAPVVLFFHGNGEIVADYNEIGLLYTRAGINFFPVDYRGYGRSSGQPGVATMMADCLKVFGFIQNWMADNGYTGPLVVMGRSLGSACALEIAATRQDDFSGLVIESGFAQVLPLLRLLGVNAERMGITEEVGFRNIDKISSYRKPLLVIHAEYDHIISFADGRELFEVCPSADKKFLKIDQADHNTIFYYGFEAYLYEVKSLLEKLTA